VTTIRSAVVAALISLTSVAAALSGGAAAVATDSDHHSRPGAFPAHAHPARGFPIHPFPARSFPAHALPSHSFPARVLTAGATSAGAPQLFSGQAFDTCSTPNVGAMKAWRAHSPYGALGVYIGGRNRGCAQTRLTASWTRSVTAQGWRLLPLYVGLQAPCLTGAHTSTIAPNRALSQGTAEGRDAVRAAEALALAPGSPIYLDMESYARDRSRCTLAVLQYTAAWSRAVRAAGYLAGFYSSSNTGIADIAAVGLRSGNRALATDLPDVVWYARWDKRASTDGFHTLANGQWGGHRRIHQFVGNARETHGGVTMSIDRNAVDAPVALVR
jgi:hypothetical protein